MRQPTQPQQAVCKFVAMFMDSRHMAPTITEIAKHFGYRSDNAASTHVQALIQKGLVTRTPGIARGLLLTPEGLRVARECTADVAAIAANAATSTVRKNNAARDEELLCQAQTEWGVDAAGVEFIRAHGVADAYEKQRTNARRRGIPWLFTRATWWRVWLDSGRYEERGCTAQEFVMARHLDSGPYAPWNVSIKTASENCSEAQANKRARPSSAGWGLAA